MAIYLKNRTQLNDMERQQATAVFTLEAEMKPAVRADGAIFITTDDAVAIGSIAPDSVVTDIRILVQEAFDGTTPAIDIGFGNYPNGEFDGTMTAIETGIVVDTVNDQIVIDMPTSGVVDKAGAAYTGTRGGIWSSTPTGIAVIYKGATTPTVGKIKILMSYTYFGTKSTGAYTN